MQIRIHLAKEQRVWQFKLLTEHLQSRQITHRNIKEVSQIFASSCEIVFIKTSLASFISLVCKKCEEKIRYVEYLRLVSSKLDAYEVVDLDSKKVNADTITRV